ncbi:MAG TPA: APC family permease [Rhabdochlamydiaceae bacterium]|nr:APC family permease [Rhabdochlamydiaceae bacterium]
MAVYSSSRGKVLGFFQLVMINVIAVDSIRTLPFSAVYGFSLVFFYLLAALTFFIPTALVSAELGTGWPNRGGIYVWVREAFGKKVSFVVIWLNWVYNLLWYPTIMALIAGTFAYFFDSKLADNRLYMCLSVLVLFWGATLINCLGMKASSILSTLGALIGTIFPMLLITLLGIIWVMQDKPIQIQLDWDHFFPSGSQSSNLSFLTNVLFGLVGLEMAATHASEMRNPARDYPRSLLVACIIIFATIVCASLALAIVVPNDQLSLATGIMQAFAVFTQTYNLPWLLPLIAGFIVLGGLSAVGAWIIGPTKGLMVATVDGSLPAFLGRTNKQGVPVAILLTQAVIVSLLCLLFILLPTVNSSFWLLSVITAQVALLVYIALFAAAVKLHYSKPDVPRHFRIPGKKFGVWTVSGFGILSCFAVFLFGFLPPAQVPFQNLFLYELILICGIVICCGLPLLIIKKRSLKKRA